MYISDYPVELIWQWLLIGLICNLGAGIASYDDAILILLQNYHGSQKKDVD